MKISVEPSQKLSIILLTRISQTASRRFALCKRFYNREMLCRTVHPYRALGEERGRTVWHHLRRNSFRHRWITDAFLRSHEKCGLTMRICLCFLLSGASACSRAAKPVSNTWACMGTYASLTLSADEEAALDSASATAAASLCDLDNRLSIFKPDSEISRLNRSAGASPVQISAMTENMLQLSTHYSEATDGTFDPTVAPLMRLWGFNKGPPLSVVPDSSAISSVLERVGYHHLSVSNGAAFLDREGMGIDLGGIGKGYAVDVCYEALVTNNIKNLMVNLGGHIRCRGSAGPGRPWSIGIRDPFDHDRIVGTLRLSDGMAVATSGNYEKFFMLDGKRYIHIMNPLTGYPVEGVASVTIIADSAVKADAMTKPFFVLGLDKSLPILARTPNCHVIFIPDERPTRIYISPGVRKYFTPDSSFDGQILDINQNTHERLPRCKSAQTSRARRSVGGGLVETGFLVG